MLKTGCEAMPHKPFYHGLRRKAEFFYGQVTVFSKKSETAVR